MTTVRCRRWSAGGVVAVVCCWLAVGPVWAAFTDTVTNPQVVQAAEGVDPPEPVAGVRVQSLRSRSDGDTQIVATVQVLNDSAETLDLSSVTLRYWFTPDGASSLVSDCYYAAVGCSQVTHQVVVPEPSHAGGNRYLAIGFTAGSVPPGSSSGEIQIGLRRSGAGSFDQSDDYSTAAGSSFADTSTVTAYVAGALVWGVEPEVLAAGTSVGVLYANFDEKKPADSQAKPGLVLANTGTVTVELSRITVRYWFSADSSAPPGFEVWCDYSQSVPCNQITRRVVGAGVAVPGADHYVEVGFTTGSLPSGASTGEMRFRFNKTDWSSFDESDDYSWGDNDDYEPTDTVTVYVDGVLIGGVEP